MGSIFGARFAQANHEVVLLDVVEPLVDRINAEGLTIVRDKTETNTRVEATTDPSSVGVADLVVFFTKCYHTASAARGRCRSSGRRRWSRRCRTAGATATSSPPPTPADRITLGVTYNSGLLLEPGRVVHPSDQPTIVGSFTDGDTAGAERLAQALRDGASRPRSRRPCDPRSGRS